MELIHRIPEIQLLEAPNAKALRVCYIDAMKTHAPEEWVRVIKTVRDRILQLARTSRTQRISDTERSFEEDAKRYLRTELSLALEMPAEELEAYIRAQDKQ